MGQRAADWAAIKQRLQAQDQRIAELERQLGEAGDDLDRAADAEMHAMAQGEPLPEPAAAVAPAAKPANLIDRL